MNKPIIGIVCAVGGAVVGGIIGAVISAKESLEIFTGLMYDKTPMSKEEIKQRYEDAKKQRHPLSEKIKESLKKKAGEFKEFSIKAAHSAAEKTKGFGMRALKWVFGEGNVNINIRV